MGDDARAGFQLAQEFGPELFHEIRQDVERYDGGLANVGLEHILLDEFSAIADRFVARVAGGELDQLGIDVDAETVGVKLLRRGDDHPAVAGAEIDDKVFGGDPGHLQHLVDNDLRCRHIGQFFKLLGLGRGR